MNDFESGLSCLVEKGIITPQEALFLQEKVIQERVGSPDCPFAAHIEHTVETASRSQGDEGRLQIESLLHSIFNIQYESMIWSP
jgi:hypothetical protein